MSKDNDNKGKNILLVDEDRFLLGIYSKRLMESGWDVDFAVDEKGAEEMLKKKAFKAVVLDVQIGNTPGMEVFESLKSKGLFKQSKVIVLTNTDEEKSVKEAHNLGADGYIVKSHNTPAEIVEEIGNICKSKALSTKP